MKKPDVKKILTDSKARLAAKKTKLVQAFRSAVKNTPGRCKNLLAGGKKRLSSAFHAACHGTAEFFRRDYKGVGLLFNTLAVATLAFGAYRVHEVYSAPEQLPVESDFGLSLGMDRKQEILVDGAAWKIKYDQPVTAAEAKAYAAEAANKTAAVHGLLLSMTGIAMLAGGALIAGRKNKPEAPKAA